jgi:hypothetical protein
MGIVNIPGRPAADPSPDLDYLGFRSFSKYSVAISRATITAKVVAPIRAAIRMARRERPKS